MSQRTRRWVVALTAGALTIASTIALLSQLQPQQLSGEWRVDGGVPVALDSTAVATFQRIAELETPAALGPGARLVIIGDSVGASFGRGLVPVAATRGVTVVQHTAPGCSTIGGYPLLANGDIVPWTPNCLDYLGRWRAKVAATPATAILWLSAFDGADRLVFGERADPASPEGRQQIAELIIETADVVAAPGSNRQIVFLLPAPNAPSRLHGAPHPRSAIAVENHRAILHLVVERDPSRFSLLRLDRFLCPRGAPCPAEPEPGIEPRSHDGGHFTQEGAEWIAARVLDTLGVV